MEEKYFNNRTIQFENKHFFGNTKYFKYNQSIISNIHYARNIKNRSMKHRSRVQRSNRVGQEFSLLASPNYGFNNSLLLHVLDQHRI